MLPPPGADGHRIASRTVKYAVVLWAAPCAARSEAAPTGGANWPPRWRTCGLATQAPAKLKPTCRASRGAAGRGQMIALGSQLDNVGARTFRVFVRAVVG
jgi:hypothetical protein